MRLSKGIWNEYSRFPIQGVKISLLNGQIAGLTQTKEVLFYTMHNLIVEPIATGCCGGQNCKWVQRETCSRRIELTKPVKYEGSDTISGLGEPWNFHCWKLGEYSRIHFPCSHFLLSHSLHWPLLRLGSVSAFMEDIIGIILWKALHLPLEWVCSRSEIFFVSLGLCFCQVGSVTTQGAPTLLPSRIMRMNKKWEDF